MRHLRKKKNFALKSFVVILSAIILSTLGIKAADKFNKNLEDNKSLCPKDMVYIMSSEGDFCIDKYEVSPSKDCPFINPKNQGETRSNLDLKDCQPVSLKDKTPWRFVSQNQAMMACARAGKRLPTNKEWYLASLGTPDKNENWEENDCQVNNNWGEQPGKTGSAENCISSAGAYDMVGNVWEWVDEEINNGKYNGEEMPQQGFVQSADTKGVAIETDLNQANENYYNDYLWLKTKGIKGIARGGYWDNEDEAGIYSLYAVFGPAFSGSGIGFRCVK